MSHFIASVFFLIYILFFFSFLEYVFNSLAIGAEVKFENNLLYCDILDVLL